MTEKFQTNVITKFNCEWKIHLAFIVETHEEKLQDKTWV